MENRIIQYISIIAVLATIVGSYFFFRSEGSTKINSSQETKLTDGLVGYWSFDGNHIDWSATGAEVRDQSGNGYHGGINGGINVDTGKIGQALNIDGINGSYINTSNITEIDNSSYLTMSAWVNFNTISLADIVLEFDNFTEWSGLLLDQGAGGWCNANNIAAILSNGGSNTYGCTTSNPIQTGNWYYLTMVFDGTQVGNNNRLKLYINGSEETLTFTGTIPSTTADVTNGFDIGYSIFTLDGKIDEVRVYNRALSINEITELYNQGQVKINASQEMKLTDGLTGYWTFDGNDMDWGAGSAEALDQSGSGYDGDVSNTMDNSNATIGKIGQALDFNGTDEHIQLADTYNFVTSSVGTISAWIKPRGSAYSTGYVYNLPGIIGGGGGCIGIHIGNDIAGPATGDKIWVYNWDGNDDQVGVSYNNDEWVHITWVHNSGNIYVYKNGAYAGVTASGGSSCGGQFRIGRSYIDETTKYFNGQVDEVRTYNRILTQAEISELYSLGQVKINASQETKLTDGLVGNWTFDGNHMDWSAGSEVIDQGTGGNDGNINAGSSNPTATIGKVGQSLDFNGTADYIDVSGLIQAVSPPISFGAWVKFDSVPSSNKKILMKSGSFAMTAAPTYVMCNDTNTGRGPVKTLTWSADQWYHIVCVINESEFTGTEQFMYINGSDSGAISDGWYPWDLGANSLKIGSNNAGTGQNFDGKIDEVRIYDRSLASDEVNQLYMMGR
ncbi:LamG domain-containing protein [Patescibacteria group bacterium]